VRLAALALVALALTACESNQERSASIGKARAQHNIEVTRHIQATQRALRVTRLSATVKATATTILKGREGYAAVVTLENLSATSYRDVPVEIDVRDAHGATVYTNDTPGLAAGLNSEPLLAAHGTATWIDDQVQASDEPRSMSVRIGEGTPVSGATPVLDVEGARRYEDPTNGPALEGSVVNRSKIEQQELIVYALVRRAGAIVAAGRSVLPSVRPGAAARFQLFFTGDPNGGELELSAPPSTFG